MIAGRAMATLVRSRAFEARHTALGLSCGIERQLPRQHAARLTKAPPEGKIAAAGRGDGCRVGGESEKSPTVEQPEQTSAVDAGERFGSVATE